MCLMLLDVLDLTLVTTSGTCKLTQHTARTNLWSVKDVEWNEISRLWSPKNQPQRWLNATGTAQPRAVSVWMFNLAHV